MVAHWKANVLSMVWEVKFVWTGLTQHDKKASKVQIVHQLSVANRRTSAWDTLECAVCAVNVRNASKAAPCRTSSCSS
jgi:hypothetical protein